MARFVSPEERARISAGQKATWAAMPLKHCARCERDTRRTKNGRCTRCVAVRRANARWETRRLWR